MILDYLGIPADYDYLIRLLGTTDQGTPFPNVKHLEIFGLFVEVGKRGDLSLFEDHIDLGLPIITGVKTVGWRHWAGEETRHAVVVVGIDRHQDKIYINDPFFGAAPIEMSLLEFEIGWDEQDRSFAIIGLAKPKIAEPYPTSF